MPTLAGIDVSGRSIAGVETCIQLPTLGICLDMGVCPRSAVRLRTVLFTHAHVDHMAGVIHHCATRALQGMKPPRYVMPPRIVDNFHAMLDAWRRLDGSDLPCEVIGLAPGDELRLRPDLVTRPFATPHRVVSQGYTLWQQKKKLRADLAGASRQQIIALREAGEDITEHVETPLLSFTGDSCVDVLDSAPELLRSRLLIMELTFVDDRVSVAKTRDKGHIHLDEIVPRADSFENEAILFTHLSARYSTRQAREMVDARLPPSLLSRVALLGELA